MSYMKLVMGVPHHETVVSTGFQRWGGNPHPNDPARGSKLHRSVRSRSRIYREGGMVMD